MVVVVLAREMIGQKNGQILAIFFWHCGSLVCFEKKAPLCSWGSLFRYFSIHDLGFSSKAFFSFWSLFHSLLNFCFRSLYVMSFLLFLQIWIFTLIELEIEGFFWQDWRLLQVFWDGRWLLVGALDVLPGGELPQLLAQLGKLPEVEMPCGLRGFLSPGSPGPGMVTITI